MKMKSNADDIDGFFFNTRQWQCNPVHVKTTDTTIEFEHYRKPQSASQLDEPEGCAHNKESSTDNDADWYIYEMNVAHQPAPVGTKVLVDCHHQGMRQGVVIGAFQRWNWVDVTGFEIGTFDMILVKPLDHDRKAKAEREAASAARKAAVDAAMDEIYHIFADLYDKGILKSLD